MPLKEDKVTLKELSPHLKYVYLEEGEKKPVVISAALTMAEEARLVEVLRNNKEAFGWNIGDLKGISPTKCMHRIALEENSKPKRQPQRRLNPTLNEVIKNEIIKLHGSGLIYPVADSEWVSPIHVVPKKGGITVEENEKGQLIATRLKTGWRMCIDYRKLNAVTRKDHSPSLLLIKCLTNSSDMLTTVFLMVFQDIIR